MKRRPYPHYKPSEIEWLGDVPEHWEIKRFRDQFAFKSGGTPDTSIDEYWEGPIPWASAKDLRGLQLDNTEDHISAEAIAESATTLVPRGSLLILTRSGILRHSLPVSVIMRDMAINQDVKACIADGSTSPLFIAYLISGMQDQFLTLWRQQGATVESLDFDAVKATQFALPPWDEQLTIQSFLDREVKKLDSLIFKKRALVARLRDKRSGLISQTVIRGLPPEAARAAGLNPHPKLKPSGIGWIGDIPEHWETRRLRHISDRITVGVVVNPSNYVADGGVPFLLGGDIREFAVDTDDSNQCAPEISDGELVKSRLSGRDLVVVRVGYPGVAAVIPPELEGANCASMMIVGRHLRFCSEWLAYAFNSSVGKDQIEIVQYGAAQKQFNIGHAVDFAFPFPSLQEQIKIARFLDVERAKIEGMMLKIEQAIARLQEYRTALIKAAVTGKIDLREAVSLREPAALAVGE